MTPLQFEGGSYRDRRGRVLEHDGRVIRSLSAEAAEDLAWLERNGILARLIDQGLVVRTWRPDGLETLRVACGAASFIEHERLAFISYPYEWPFSALKAAALHHLELHLEALRGGATLSDASAYNVQFTGTKPVFIDVLSLRPYREGEYWVAHQQFLDQFLNPLLLDALSEIAPQRLYRGALEGVPTATLNRLLKLRHKLRFGVLTHVVLPAALQRFVGHNDNVRAARAMQARPLSKTAYIGMLDGLSRLIARLKPRARSGSAWSSYTTTSSYTTNEFEQKRGFVAEYASKTRPKMLLDVGCNTGAYSEIALAAGACCAVGIEQDAAAADLAFRRAADAKLNLLPLVVDAANPSPEQGWRGLERHSFASRSRFDGMIALAVEHHLAIGRNIPLDELLDYLTGLAPSGVIEFVPKSDPQVQRLLRLREDIFADHTEDAFSSLLSARARIVRKQTITNSGRVLFWYDRAGAQ